MLPNPLVFFSFLGLLFILSGCQVQGISGPGKTTTLGYDLTALQSTTRNETAARPYKLIVAQAGALSPDEGLLRELRRHPKLFKEVVSIPASPELRNFGREVTQKDPKPLVKLARDLGGDLLFLVGGKIESSSTRTPISVLDLSIIGKYIIPSNKVKGKASVLGVLISLPDERLVMSVDQSLMKSTMTPSISKHSKVETLIQRMSEELLKGLGQKFVRELSDRAGVSLDPTEVSNSPSLKEQKSSLATVYILSDGLHIGLILPYSNFFGEKQYVEIGLGERDWVVGKGWKWMDSILAFTSENDGVAVLEKVHPLDLKDRLKKTNKVWKVQLTEEDFGKMLVSLESDLSFQKVLFDGYKTKVIENHKGYDLFYTCHQFALNPLGVTGKGLFDSIPLPTPMVEKRLDEIFKRSE